MIRKLLFYLCPFCICCLSGCGEKKESEAAVADLQLAAYHTDEFSIQSGMALFNTHCAGCHNFQQQEIGPNLSGITLEADKEWLSAFIRNPAGMIESGDGRATESFEKYGIYMPAFSFLEDEEMEQLLGFIHVFSKAEKRNTSNRTGGLLNPVPEKIPESGLTLVIEDAYLIPATADNPPLTRINKMEPQASRGSQRVFVSDLRGMLYRLERDSVFPYLDVGGRFPDFIDRPGLGTGFGSFAFHPAFEENGLLYTTHTESAGSALADFRMPDSVGTALQWVLSEWQTKNPHSDTFQGTQREVLRIDMHSAVHGVQEIKFNPNAKPGQPDYGLLYIGVGDGGTGQTDKNYLASSHEWVWGSVLRIDPLGTSSRNGKYGIPPDNPLVETPGALPEVWCRGFRNPHRFSWDTSGSGKMFISNIGQHSVEEINLGKAGADYGWPRREGTLLFDPAANTELVYPLPADDQGFTYPVAQYDHDEGNAVCGGYVYTRDDIPLLKGKYIFGDIPRGSLFFANLAEMQEGSQAPVFRFGLEYQGRPVKLVDLVPGQRVDLRLGLGPGRALYLFTKADGRIYRVNGCKKMQEAVTAP
ncbi:PQQ-dependent sugar dehydrogenase [Robiginitalea sp. SC105]|uniref:PQQ-dependent sugar dehydrogenase n=1 Tax=Robiginitalea sp. SC105 TaxID=2762332 RepID=UPI00163B2097|nr:PQQ-dependent sugar dehydrogenase [Robiginitalea sp. SC105]MBC2840365.1 PQQ-dependent sugar dehydrogenase [Robiginitalea sp. SC105]